MSEKRELQVVFEIETLEKEEVALDGSEQIKMEKVKQAVEEKLTKEI